MVVSVTMAVVASDFTPLNFFPSSFLASSPTRRMPRRVRFIRNRLEITFPPIVRWKFQEVLYERFEDRRSFSRCGRNRRNENRRETHARERSLDPVSV